MHEHNHYHISDVLSSEELTALLEFTVKHNLSHTGELSDLAEKLKKAGNTAAAEKILSALEEYNKGNGLLEEALKAVKGDK